MRALICHGQCKSEPEPEVDTEMTSIFNGNIKDPNQVSNCLSGTVTSDFVGDVC